MLMIGKPEFSKIEGYKEISADFTAESSILQCKEIQFVMNGKSVVALMKLVDLVGVLKPEEHSAKDDLFYLQFNAEKYQKWSSTEKKRVDVEPAPYENYMVEFFTNGKGKEWVDSKSVFSGNLSLHNQQNIIDLLPTTPTLVFSLETVDSPEFIKPVSIKAGGFGGKGGYKGETEAEKLAARKAFIITEFGLPDCKDLMELASSLHAEEPIEFAMRLMAIVFK